MRNRMAEKEYTIEELEKILRLERNTIYRRIHSGQLRARREGRGWRVPQSDLDAYIESTYHRKREQEPEPCI